METDSLTEHGIDLHGLFDELVERSGMSKYKIAQETGLSESVLSNYTVRKRRPTLEALVAIAALSGSTVDVSLRPKSHKPKTASKPRA